MTFSIKAVSGEITPATRKIQNELDSCKISSRSRMKAVLTFEEVLNKIIEKNADTEIEISVIRKFKKAEIRISYSGEEIELVANDEALGIDLQQVEDEDAEAVIRNILIKSFSDNIKGKSKNGRSRIRITAGAGVSNFMLPILVLAAVVIGILMRTLLPADVNMWLCDNFFGIFVDIFMNAIKLILVPLVFFSITSSVIQFSDLKEIGRIGGKTMLFYMFTSITAILIGMGVFFVFKPGSLGAMAGPAISGTSTDFSILSVITGIIPSDLISPIANADMLQIIFLALIIGIGVNYVKTGRTTIVNAINSLNELTMAVTGIIMKVIPILMFCSILYTMLSIGTDALISIAAVPVLVALAIALMMSFYCLLLYIMAGLNPFVFMKKIFNHILFCMATMSSSAAIPRTMEVCKSLGVSKRVYSFSIPLGATINMDGTSIGYVLTCLTALRLSGVEHIEFSLLLTILLTTLLISVAVPGTPGAACSMVTMLLCVAGVSEVTLPMCLALETIYDFLSTANNVVGDIVASTIVSKQEGLFDKEQFYRI